MRPLLSYFAAQEIPAALITFVSLLIFLQTGTDPALSVFYSALLAMPWAMKVWLGRVVLRSGRFRAMLLLCELLLTFEFLLLSMVLSPSSFVFGWARTDSGNGLVLFTVLFLLSLTTAWHERVATLYYDTHLHSRLRVFYNAPRVAVSQVLIVVTYGLFIIFVGTLEVYTRSIFLSWATGAKIAAGTMLLFVLWHCQPHKQPQQPHPQQPHPLPLPREGSGYRRGVNASHGNVGSNASRSDVGNASRSDVGNASRSDVDNASLGDVGNPSCKGNYSPPSGGEGGGAAGAFVPLLFLFLLPQSLMFYTRVLYFLAPTAEGGLSCSLQVLGFAHGVVGALAFSFGLVASRWVRGARHSALLVTLSPSIYLYMNVFPPTSLWMLCLCTFVAQLSFGYGLHHALHRLGLSAAFGLRQPMVALVMLPAMAVSGWLVQWLGFSTFFLVDTLTALLAIPAWFVLSRDRNGQSGG